MRVVKPDQNVMNLRKLACQSIRPGAAPAERLIQKGICADIGFRSPQPRVEFSSDTFSLTLA